jgi:hypothetical protein
MQNNEVGPLPYTIYKKQINVRPKSIKLLEENIQGKLLNTRHGNDLLDITPKA